MKEGERIQVQTKSFKGMATILYIAPGEFYPVQVEMDSPDPDGHKIYRVASHEIVDELPAENEAPAAAETFADPEQHTGWGYVDADAPGAKMAYPVRNVDIKEINSTNRSAVLIEDLLGRQQAEING